MMWLVYTWLTRTTQSECGRRRIERAVGGSRKAHHQNEHNSTLALDYVYRIAVATGGFHDFGDGDVDMPDDLDALSTTEAWLLGFALFLPGLVFFFLDLHLIKASSFVLTFFSIRAALLFEDVFLLLIVSPLTGMVLC